MKKPPLYGLMAEFTDPQSLLDAARKTYDEGYRKVDAFSPFPIEGLSEAIGFHHTRLPLIVLIGGICGCAGGFGLAYWVSTMANPWLVGGKPLFSWPAWIPVTFETTVLLAALSTVLGMLALNGLPEPYHPVFNVKRFALATKDRFFLMIEARDPKFEYDKTWRFLDTLQPRGVSEIES